MSSMSTLSVTSTWQQAYAASGTVTVVLENKSNGEDVLVHVSTTLVPTAPTTAHLTLRRFDYRHAAGSLLSLALASGDELYVRTVNAAGTASVTLFTP